MNPVVSGIACSPNPSVSASTRTVRSIIPQLSPALGSYSYYTQSSTQGAQPTLLSLPPTRRSPTSYCAAHRPHLHLLPDDSQTRPSCPASSPFVILARRHPSASPAPALPIIANDLSPHLHCHRHLISSSLLVGVCAFSSPLRLHFIPRRPRPPTHPASPLLFHLSLGHAGRPIARPRTPQRSTRACIAAHRSPSVSRCGGEAVAS